MSIIQFVNCRQLRNHKIIKEDLWVRNGIILSPEKLFFEEKISADQKIDCENLIISPGFIDLQINGAFGLDFSVDDGDICNKISTVGKGLLSHGVTSFCPTIVSSYPKTYKNILPHIKKKKGGEHGAEVLGVHLEGPFINKEMKGAHEINCIQSQFKNSIESLNDMYGDLSHVAIVTLAPELPNSQEVIKYLVEKGIIVSLGHSCASLQCAELAVKNGANFVTHLFNAMLSFHHRDPHLVGIISSHEIPPSTSLFYSIIADGIHTHPAALMIAYRTHPNGIILVTDAISGMGLPTGTHHLGNQLIDIKDGRACIGGTNILCGSITSLNKCIKFFHDSTSHDIVESLETVTLHPARLMRLDHRIGTLEFGTEADFILIDENFDVHKTFIGGQLVYSLR